MIHNTAGSKAGISTCFPKSETKKYLPSGVNIRIFLLFGLASPRFYLNVHKSGTVLALIFFFISLFAVGGVLANINYTDIFGKSVNEN
jgi:hypothetical protein